MKTRAGINPQLPMRSNAILFFFFWGLKEGNKKRRQENGRDSDERSAHTKKC